MCSRKCDIPVVPGTSLRPPTWYQTQSETTGACRASSACITSPLSRRREAGASVTAGVRKVYEAGGAPRLLARGLGGVRDDLVFPRDRRGRVRVGHANGGGSPAPRAKHR